MKERFDNSQSYTVKEFMDYVCSSLPNEKGVYRVETRADDYPTDAVRAHKLSSGDELYVGDMDNIVHVGDKFKGYPAIVAEVYYTPKKWWQFWKRRKQIGYSVRWIE